MCARDRLTEIAIRNAPVYRGDRTRGDKDVGEVEINGESSKGEMGKKRGERYNKTALEKTEKNDKVRGEKRRFRVQPGVIFLHNVMASLFISREQ